MRIFLGAPDSDFREALSVRLRKRGYALETCAEPSDARFRLARETYDLAILDGSLPGAIQLLERARSNDPVLPIFVALACDSAPEARIACLDLGADDCVDRSVHLDEAEARIRALLRRSRHKRPTLACGDLHFNTRQRLFWVRGKALALPSKEHALLEALITRPGQMHTKQELADTLYTVNDDTPAGAVHLYIHRLRKRLHGAGAEIETHRGLGYLLRSVCAPTTSDYPRKQSTVALGHIGEDENSMKDW